MSPPKPYNPPQPEALKTIFEDEAIIVADKPSGLLSVPGIGPEKAVCANSILSDRHGPVLTVHRLDMDTSGLIIFARNKAAQRTLSRGFERRQVDKTYQALVQGSVEGESGIIDKAIAKFSHQRPLRHLDPEGQTAITHWTVLDRTNDTTRMSLQPQTGRSHQLRLHMMSLGHPILGDVFYGDPNTHERLCLHAGSLSFYHPVSEKLISFETETPF
ncbi:MAG: RluA family pseudouridine synthase [Henriciella sp.]|nr:RluA family pseudouridine synthase [Henriciella sp.]